MAPRKSTTTKIPSKRTGTSKAEIVSTAPVAGAAGFGSNGHARRRRAKRRRMRKSSSAPTRFSSRAVVHIATIKPTGSRPKGN